ncbi:MAG: dUTPase [Firmicutes bacterium]|nr:dUTPase [Bacillota bacterium]
MDKLDKIFEKQDQLDAHIAKTKGIALDKFTMQEWLQKKAMALVEEATEVASETGYKWWKLDKPLDLDAIKEELVDVLHFVLSMSLTLGMMSQQLFALYCAKKEENIKRQDGKSTKSGYQGTL